MSLSIFTRYLHLVFYSNNLVYLAILKFLFESNWWECEEHKHTGLKMNMPNSLQAESVSMSQLLRGRPKIIFEMNHYLVYIIFIHEQPICLQEIVPYSGQWENLSKYNAH